MAEERPTDEEIEELLTDLKSSHTPTREMAVEELGQLGFHDARVISALEDAAAHEPLPSVGASMRLALMALRKSPPALDTSARKARGKVYATRSEKTVDFAIGFLGWFLVVGLLAYAMNLRLQFNTLADIAIPVVCLPTHLAAIVVIAFYRRWMAFGALVAFSVNLAVSLSLQLFFNTACGVPFFINITAG